LKYTALTALRAKRLFYVWRTELPLCNSARGRRAHLYLSYEFLRVRVMMSGQDRGGHLDPGGGIRIGSDEAFEGRR